MDDVVHMSNRMHTARTHGHRAQRRAAAHNAAARQLLLPLPLLLPPPPPLLLLLLPSLLPSKLPPACQDMKLMTAKHGVSQLSLCTSIVRADDVHVHNSVRCEREECQEDVERCAGAECVCWDGRQRTVIVVRLRHVHER